MELQNLVLPIFKRDVKKCCGIMVSRKHMATTAQCLHDFFNDPRFDLYYAVVQNDNNLPDVRNRFFKQVEVHEEYLFTKASPNNDIGLITVNH